ncbi:MAG: hypothetical protein K5981_09405 [Clostridia bacterium]|nr:hypothetical protein [Clostridia bacterium]
MNDDLRPEEKEESEALNDFLLSRYEEPAAQVQEAEPERDAKETERSGLEESLAETNALLKGLKKELHMINSMVIFTCVMMALALVVAVVAAAKGYAAIMDMAESLDSLTDINSLDGLSNWFF